jgi:hypothetical protein
MHSNSNKTEIKSLEHEHLSNDSYKILQVDRGINVNFTKFRDLAGAFFAY